MFTACPESSIQVKEGKRNVDNEEKTSVPESMSTSHLGDRPKVSEKKDRAHSSAVDVDAVTRKSAKNTKGVAHDTNVPAEINQQTCTSVKKIQKRKRKSLTGKVSYPCC